MGCFERGVGAGRWEAAGAGRGFVVDRVSTAVPGIQEAPSPAATSRRTLTGLPRSTHTRCGRGGCLLYPGDGGAHPIDHKSSTGACRFPAASPYTPLKQPINEAADNETSTEVHAIHPSGLALTCDPRMERGPSGLNSELRTPPSPAAHVRAGTGHRAPARNYATDISRPSCLRVHSQRATSCRNLKYCFTRLCR